MDCTGNGDPFPSHMNLAVACSRCENHCEEKYLNQKESSCSFQYMNSEGNIHHSLTRSCTFSQAIFSWAFRAALGSQKKCIRFKRGTPKVLDAGRKKVSWLPRYATKKYTEESSETENI